MNRFLNTLFSFALLYTTQAWAFDWNTLWRNQNQQGEKAFLQGKYKQSEQLFKSKSWQTAAAYRAGEYKKALQGFKRDTSAVGDFNQGNALAFLGEYKEAIKAYENALKKNPNMADAKYNKDLLEKLLNDQKQKEQQKNKEDKDKNKKDKDKKNDDSQDKQKKQNNKEQGKDGEEKKNKEPKDKNNADNIEQAKTDKEKNDTEKTSVDVKQASGDKATEQWLRNIPDDPGGLLRQKFLRDHLRYQNENAGASS